MTLMQTLIAAPFEGCVKEDASWWEGLSWTVPGCPDPASPVGDWVKDSIMAPYIEDAKQGVEDTTKTMATFWVSTPDPTIQGGGASAEAVQFLSSNLAWLAAVIMTIIIAWNGFRLLWEHRTDGVKAVATMIAVYIFTTGILLSGITATLVVMSELAKKVLGSSTEGTAFADNIFGLFNTTVGIGSAILLIGLWVVAMLLSGLMVGIMIARGGILIALCGSIAIGAAASGTETGMQSYRTQLAWVLAWCSIKLTGAIIFAAGFRLLGTDIGAGDNGFLQIMQGLVLIFLAILALPASMRLISPIVAPAASGNGMGGAVAGAGLALGAASIRRG